MAVAGPPAAEGGLTVGLILLAAACLTLIALNKVYKLTIGALVSTLASMFDSIRTPKLPIIGSFSLGFIGDALLKVDNYVLEAIGTGIEQTEKGMHALLGAMTWLLQETADQLAGLAEDTSAALERLVQTWIPNQIRAFLKPYLGLLHTLQGELGHLLHAPATIIHKTTQVLAPGLKALEGQVAKLEAKVAALATAGVAANPTPIIERVGAAAPAIPADIYRGIDSLWKDVKRIGKVLTPVGIVGLVAGALLATLKLPWLKCRNVDKAGRALCGMNTDVLEGLLAGLLALFGTFSLVEFAKYLLPIADEVGGEVTHFWRADVAHQGGDRQLGDPSLS